MEKNINTVDVLIYTTQDEWEARFLRAALLNENIRCKMQSDGKGSIGFLVAEQDRIEAMEVVSRVSLASTEFELDEDESEESIDSEESKQEEDNIEEIIPKAAPTSTKKEVIAKREGIGEIIHHVGRGYELKVGPVTYPMISEDRWDEFLNFSAQRQEFSFLLKNEYEDLYNWLKEEKMMSEFVRLVESTYREVPPPHPAKKKKTKPINNLVKLSLVLAFTGVLAIIFRFSWYAELALAISAGITGLIAKYQLEQNEGKESGRILAILSIIISCAVIAFSLLRGY